MDECVVCVSYLANLDNDLNPGTANGWVDHVDLNHPGEERLRSVSKILASVVLNIWKAREYLG